MPITDRTARLLRDELKRLEKERESLEETITHLRATLAATISPSTQKKPRRKSSASKSTSKTTKAKSSKKAWKPSGRAAQALSRIQKNPGITPSELSKQMKLKSSTAIYPALNKLKAEGFIKKQGKGYAAK